MNHLNSLGNMTRREIEGFKNTMTLKCDHDLLKSW